jgi:hypothetical protein
MSNWTFIVTHGPMPLYPIRDDVHLVWLSREAPPSDIKNPVIMAYDLFEGPEQTHQRLSGSMGSIATFRYLETLSKKPERVTVSQYRKFNSKTPFGLPHSHFKRIPASSYIGMQIIDPSMTSPIDPFPSGTDTPFVVSPRRKFRDVMSQHAYAHDIENLLLLVVAGIRSGNLTREEGLRLLQTPYFIPGGLELGTFPYAFWRSAMGRMVGAVEYFLDHFWNEVLADGEQSREVSFAMERYGSFLIIDHLVKAAAEGAPIREPYGYIHTVFRDPLNRRTAPSRWFFRLRNQLSKYR